MHTLPGWAHRSRRVRTAYQHVPHRLEKVPNARTLPGSLSQQRPRVAGTVQHSHDGDFAIRVAVVEGVLLVEMDSQAGREIVAARSQLRMNQQRREAGLDFANERRSGGGTPAFGDERPNPDQVFFGLLGEAEAASGVNRWRPV
jgi:hypothetical protein